MGPSLNFFAAVVFFTFVRTWLPREQSRAQASLESRRRAVADRAVTTPLPIPRPHFAQSKTRWFRGQRAR